MSSEEKTYLLDICYNGSGSYGFQSQTDKNSIQDKLEKGLSVYFRKPIKLKGSSRTDSGVHALGQKAVFNGAEIKDERKFLLGINALIPRDISVKAIKKVPASFNPIHEAKAKVYRYSLWRGRCYNPFLDPFVWQVVPQVDFDVVEQQLQFLCGKHDFTSFCSLDSTAKTKERHIFEIKVVKHENSCDIWFLGKGFLKQMIRIIVGTVVQLSLGKLSSKTTKEILAYKDRQKAGLTAPGKGLFLFEIFFQEPGSLDDYLASLDKKAFLYH